MLKMKRHWLFILLCCLPNWLYANEALDNFLHDLRTLYGEFDQTLYDESGELLEKSQGKMYILRPNHFRWVYQKPYKQLIVANEKKVWIYDQDLEQVTEKKLDKTLGKTPAFLLSSNRNIEEDFFVKQLPTQQNKTRLELKPKDTQTSFDSIRINLRGKNLLGFELLDNLGQTTKITFRRVMRNRELNKNLFIFLPPAGVDIIRDN